MAFARSESVDENFLCSICRDVFTQPVTIPCGHNYCLKCITDYWVLDDTVCVCPLCKDRFYIRPVLRVNTVIAEMVAKSKRSEHEPGNGNVLCDECNLAGKKCTALKSCLVCLMSYCETHLVRHRTILALKKHKLIHPVEKLEKRTCEKHGRLLELFCRVDSKFLCESCKDSEHKTHKIVTLEEEAQIRKTNLRIEKKGRDQMIQARQQKIAAIQESAEASKNNADKAVCCSMHVMSAVVEYIKRSQAALAEVIETKQKKTETEAEGFIKEMEEEIRQIKQKNTQLNQLLLTEDPFKFFEDFSHLTITLEQVKDWSDVMVHNEQFTVQGAIITLEETFARKISMICDPDFKEMKQHAVDVTLDPDTANSFLIVSKDGKQVTCGDRRRNLPNKPGRFDQVLNVFATDGFSSGKYYYETEVKDKTHWYLGVANESINRKGDIRLCPENGYWTIFLRKGNEFTANTSSAIKLHVREMPQKVGVFVDYEKGQVSFYDVDNRACIFSFTGSIFTEKLFPFFSPGANNGGKNSAPLIITPVKYNK